MSSNREGGQGTQKSGQKPMRDKEQDDDNPGQQKQQQQGQGGQQRQPQQDRPAGGRENR